MHFLTSLALLLEARLTGLLAKVTLTCLAGDLLPTERLLTLDIDEPSIQIGRASKTLSKGLQAARENAWFDSPVMSRDHAELSYDTGTSVSRQKHLSRIMLTSRTRFYILVILAPCMEHW
jgi:hypothetical protein